MKRLLTVLDWISTWIGNIFLTMITVLVICQIIFRAFHHALSWSEEIMRYMFVWIVFLGGYIASRTNQHLGIDVFVEGIFKGKSRKWAERFTSLMVIVYLGILTYYGFSLAKINMGQPSAVLELPMGLPYLAIPVGTLLMGLSTIHKLLAKNG